MYAALHWSQTAYTKEDSMDKEFENCYVQLDMDVKVTEMFDANGKFIFIGNIHKEAILHAAQANNQNKLYTIKKMMWDELIKEKQWKLPEKTNFLHMCNFTLKKVARMCKPISYNI